MHAPTLPFQRTQNREFSRSIDLRVNGLRPTRWAGFHSLRAQYAERDLNKIESTLAETLVALILIP